MAEGSVVARARCFVVVRLARFRASWVMADWLDAAWSKAGSFKVVATVFVLADVLVPQAALAQMSINESGSPAYNHVITVPPGIAGMVPKVGLRYSGAGLNGVVGYGWSIDGVSAISRCPNIKSVDGISRTVDYTAADRLCLDGQRLIQVDAAGNPLAFPQTNDSLGGSALVREYRTEKESYSRIRAYGSAGGVAANGPAYFKVWTKGGQIYEYGNNANSSANAAIAIEGKTAISDWVVSRISDTQGNYIDFQYEQRFVAWGSGSTAGSPTLGREWNLAEIRYTGTSTQQPVNKVVFEYLDRPDTPNAAQDRAEGYHQGSKNVSVRLLKSVRTYTNWPANVAPRPAAAPAEAVKIKVVKLTYDQGPVTQRSRLVRIQECTGAAETACLPALAFNYSAGGNEAYVANSTFSSSALATTKLHSKDGTLGLLLLDFDGDGRTDLLRWSDTAAQNELYRSLGDGRFEKVPSGAAAGQFNITSRNLFKSDGCFASMVADFNGDGLPDILSYANPNSPIGDCAVSESSYLYSGNGDGSFTQRSIVGVSLGRQISRVILGCEPNGAAPGLNRLCPNTDPPFPVGWTAGRTFFLLDVDGDGKLDVVTANLPLQTGATFFRNGGVSVDPCLTVVCSRVFKGDGLGGFTEMAGVNIANRLLFTNPDSFFQIGQPSRSIDIDGDGLTDIVMSGKSPSNEVFNLAATPGVNEVVAAWRSRGDGNFDAIPYSSNLSTTPCTVPIDFNGDGRSDCLKPSKRTLSVRRGALEEGAVADFNLTGAGEELEGVGIGVVVADFNGDGRQDILRWKDDSSQNVVYLSNGDGRFKASASFTSSFNTAANQLSKSDNTAVFLIDDFTGLGAVEILRLKDAPSAGEGTSNQLYVKSDATPPDQLISFTSSTGLKTTLKWVPLSSPSSGALGSRYASDRGTANAAAYPGVDLTFPLHVVVTSESETGVGATIVKTEFSYAGLKSGYDSRGLRGFREVRRQSPGADGSDLTVVTRFLQDYPYGGVAHITETYLGALNALPANPISRSTNIYCEKTAPASAEASATPSAPCPVPTTTRIQRPYLYRNSEQSWELPANGGAALPEVTTTTVFNDTGDPTSIVVTTSGTALGVAQQFRRTTTHQYFASDTAGDNWILGQVKRSTQQNSVPNSLGSIVASYGSAPLANATQGQGAVLSLAGPSFADTQVGQSVTGTATLSNTGTAAGAVTAPTAAAVSGGDFSFVATTCDSSLAAGASCTVTVRFTPSTVGTRNGRLTLQTQTGPLTSNLTGNGTGVLTPTLVLSACSAVSPTIAPTAASLSCTLSNGGLTGVTSISYSTIAGITVAGPVGACAGNAVCGTVRLTTNGVAGSYVGTLTATPNTGVAGSVAVNLVVNAPLSVSVASAAIAAARNNPGTGSAVASANATGGTSPYTYAWARTVGTRSTASNAAITNPTLSATLSWAENFTETWRVTVRDAAGNTATADVNVSFSTPAQPTVGISPSVLSISRNNPGTAAATMTAAAAGGVAPFSYSWARTTGTRSAISSATSASGSVSASLSWGENFTETWQVVVTDAAGNVASTSVNVTFASAAQPVVSVSPRALTVNAAAPGVATGAVTSSAAGGVPPFSYAWTRTAGTRTAVSNATVASPNFSATLGYGENFTDTWLLTATDAAGNAVSSAVTTNFTSLAASTLSLSVANVALSGVGGRESSSGPITLTNSGPSPVSALNWSFGYVSGDSGGSFSMGPNSCTALAPGASCTFAITFASNCGFASQTRWTLTIQGTGAGNTLALPLTGTTRAGACL